MEKKQLWLLSVRPARLPLQSFFGDPDGFTMPNFLKRMGMSTGEAIVKQIYDILAPLLLTPSKTE
jgi:hypothetical protein